MFIPSLHGSGQTMRHGHTLIKVGQFVAEIFSQVINLCTWLPIIEALWHGYSLISSYTGQESIITTKLCQMGTHRSSPGLDNLLWSALRSSIDAHYFLSLLCDTDQLLVTYHPNTQLMFVPPGGGHFHTWTYRGCSLVMTLIFTISRSHWPPF